MSIEFDFTLLTEPRVNMVNIIIVIEVLDCRLKVKMKKIIIKI